MATLADLIDFGVVNLVTLIGVFAIASYQTPTLFASGDTLHLRFYDLARVPDGTLKRALAETSRILAAAGIEAAWDVRQSTSPEGEEHSTDFAAPSMRIGPGSDTREFLVIRLVRGLPDSIKPTALGFSLPGSRHGAHVTIFYDRIERVSPLVPATAHKILGNALAHEIGHVLLGSEEHAESGVMKAVWNRADYRQMAAKFLEFREFEAHRMREEVSRRAMLASTN